MLSQATIDSFQNDGIAFIPGLFKAHLDSLRMGVQKNIEEPGPYAAENLNEGEIGRFLTTIVTGNVSMNFGMLHLIKILPKQRHF